MGKYIDERVVAQLSGGTDYHGLSMYIVSDSLQHSLSHFISTNIKVEHNIPIKHVTIMCL